MVQVSALYRSKCDATVTADEPLELLVLPRALMLKMVHKEPAMMTAIQDLVVSRRRENAYFRYGKQTVAQTSGIARALIVVRRALMRRVIAYREARAVVNSHARTAVTITPNPSPLIPGRELNASTAAQPERDLLAEELPGSFKKAADEGPRSEAPES